MSIFNNAAPPIELVKYIYRKEFGLSASEMEDEPLDQLFMNLRIHAFMKEKERLEQQHG